MDGVTPSDLDHQLSLAALLEDPTRRRLYQCVAASYPEAMSRDQAAKAAGVSRRLAAFHLDKLVDAGLVEPSYRRLSGRTGPGAGRPSKLYRRSSQEIRLHLPVRQYELAATILIAALERQPSQTGTEVLCETAREFGQRLGQASRPEASTGASQDELIEITGRVLGEYGYEPITEAGTTIRFRNCPFEALAQPRAGPVCQMSVALLDGFVEGLGGSWLKAIPKLDEPGCCVILRPRQAA